MREKFVEKFVELLRQHGIDEVFVSCYETLDFWGVDENGKYTEVLDLDNGDLCKISEQLRSTPPSSSS